MAYYEFKCSQCGKEFTAKQTFAEHDRHQRVKCPKCDSKKVKQVFSPHVFAHTSKKS